MLRTLGNFIVVVFWFVAGCASVQSSVPTPVPESTPRPVSGLRQSADLAAEYLVNAQKPDGSFVYRINLDPDAKVRERYNLLRHSGTLYALAMYEETFGTGSNIDAILKGVQFLQSTITSIPERQDLLAVWSDPAVTLSGAPRQAKLGGAGLGLVALLKAEQFAPGTTPAPTLRGLGDFILFMQRPDGGFFSKYQESAGGRDARWVSLYYPGEAALGLVMLFEQTRDIKYLSGAAHALGYLGQTRFGQAVVEADHWALLATQRVLTHYPKLPDPPEKVLIMSHAAQIVDSILSSRYSYPKDSVFHGALGPLGRTTPTATRVEGLLAALTFLPDQNQDLKNIILEVAPDSLGFLIRAQVKEGIHSGAIPRAVKSLGGEGPDITTFNRRLNEVRIDYVQHVLSALIQYHQL